MRQWLALAVVLACSVAVYAEPTTAPTTQASDFSLSIQSCRITRGSTSEVQKRFGNRWTDRSNDVPAMTLTLLLDNPGITLLPLSRNDLSIDTFIDDTYANLLAARDEFGATGYNFEEFAPHVSDDGHAAIFTVSTNRSIAKNAKRAFVRGKLMARGFIGQATSVRGPLKLEIGQTTKIGPFTCTVVSLTSAGRKSVGVDLAVDGDSQRIRKAVVLDSNNEPTDGDAVVNSFDAGNQPSGNSSLHLQVRTGRDEVTLQLDYVESIRRLAIPFQAQVDVGGVEVGPIERPDEPATSPRSETWPPSDAPRVLPAEMQRWQPATQATTAPSDIGVQVCMLSIAKSPVGVSTPTGRQDVFTTLRLNSFTLARLLFTTQPEMTILSFPDEGVNVSRFEDDAGPLDTQLYRSAPSGFRMPVNSIVSADGRQAMFGVELRDTPHVGATRIHVVGTVKTLLGRSLKTETSEPISTSGRQAAVVGPFQISMLSVIRKQSVQPGRIAVDDPLVQVDIVGDSKSISNVDLIDADTGRLLGNYQPRSMERPMIGPDSFSIPLRTSIPSKVQLRMSYVDKPEVVALPFDIVTPLGLPQ